MTHVRNANYVLRFSLSLKIFLKNWETETSPSSFFLKPFCSLQYSTGKGLDVCHSWKKDIPMRNKYPKKIPYQVSGLSFWSNAALFSFETLGRDNSKIIQSPSNRLIVNIKLLSWPSALVKCRNDIPVKGTPSRFGTGARYGVSSLNATVHGPIGCK